MLFCPTRFNTPILAKSFCERSNDMSSPKIVDMENPMISFFFQWPTFKLLGITYSEAFITRSLGSVRDKSRLGSDLTGNGGNSTDSKTPKTPPTKSVAKEKRQCVLFCELQRGGFLGECLPTWSLTAKVFEKVNKTGPQKERIVLPTIT